MNTESPKLVPIDYHTPQQAPTDPRRAMGLAGIVMCVIGYLLALLVSLSPFIHPSAGMTLAAICLAGLLFILSLILAVVGLAFLRGSRRYLAWSIALGFLGFYALGLASERVGL